MPPTIHPKRAATCPPKHNGPTRVREPRTTVSFISAAVSLMEVALPFTNGKLGGRGTESKEEFASLAVAERVARLQMQHGFTLPPGLALEFPFTKPK